jgi:hypothetical protein
VSKHVPNQSVHQHPNSHVLVHSPIESRVSHPFTHPAPTGSNRLFHRDTNLTIHAPTHKSMPPTPKQLSTDPPIKPSIQHLPRTHAFTHPNSHSLNYPNIQQIQASNHLYTHSPLQMSVCPSTHRRTHNSIHPASIHSKNLQICCVSLGYKRVPTVRSAPSPSGALFSHVMLPRAMAGLCNILVYGSERRRPESQTSCKLANLKLRVNPWHLLWN